MDFWDYIALSREDKIDLLYQEGERERSLGKDKDLYRLYDYWVETREDKDGDIIYLRAHQYEPD